MVRRAIRTGPLTLVALYLRQGDASPHDERRRQLVRSWFAFTETLVGQWVQQPTVSRSELLALLSDVLARLLPR